MRRWAYGFLLHALIPFMLIRLYWKGRLLRAYRERIAERFGFKGSHVSKADVWVHAVSLGEVVAATPMIEALLSDAKRVVVTTQTPTGSAQVTKQFGTRVMHQYLPYDFSWSMRWFFERIQVKVGVIMETELWPNLIHEATKAGIPLLIANGRISDKAFLQYRRITWLLKPFLQQLSLIGVQSEADATRFIALGAKPNRVMVLGNMKFDVKPLSHSLPIVESLKKSVGCHRAILLCASTHEGEELQILEKLKHLQRSIPGLLLILAPRHPERFDAVFQLSQQQGFHTARRSLPDLVSEHTEVLMIDSLGELLGFYAFSDVAFVGGSLVPIGGHNVLEPMSMGIPVICGPYMHNSKSLCEALVLAGALIQVQDVDGFCNAVIDVYQNKRYRLALVDAAYQMLNDNKGSVAQHLQLIEALMKTRDGYAGKTDTNPC